MKKIIAAVCAVTILAAAFGETPISGQTAPLAQQQPLAVEFSHPSGFYDQQFELILSAGDGNSSAAIYYTTDGSLPTAQSARYDSPITVQIPGAVTAESATRIGEDEYENKTVSGVNVFAIRAVAIDGGNISPVAVRNYVRGNDVFTRFGEEILVFSLTSDPHGLYDYYDGIFVEGVDRDVWRQEFFEQHGRLPIPGYDWREENPGSPANFNRSGEDSERRAYLEMFDSAGNLYISQDIGIRVKGGYSRASSQKSLELYARDESGAWEPFVFPFFGESVHTYDGNILQRYRRIRLRNGGSDRNEAFLRDEFGAELLAIAGIPDTQSHSPAAVFLNGEYYGVTWIKTPRTENHMSRRYGGETSRFRIIGGSENGYGWGGWEGEPDATADWGEIFRMATTGEGLTNNANWESFLARVDIENFLVYYAFQIYAQNLDWPNHNMEMWRYMPTESEKNDPTLHPYLRDGKWRWTPHDVESSWNIYGGSPASINTLHNILNGGNSNNPQWQGTSALLKAVLARDEMKLRFANTMVDLIEGACSPEVAFPVLDRLIARIDDEHDYAIRRNMFEPGGVWWPLEHTADSARAQIYGFITARPARMYGFINTTLGISRDKTFRVELNVGEGGTAIMHTRPVAEGATAVGNYYSGSEIYITAVPNPGYVVKEWVYNHEALGNDFRVFSSGGNQTHAITTEMIITLTFEKDPDFAQNGNLEIGAVKAAGNDLVEIINRTGRPLSTKGLFLSDGANYHKWALPPMIIPAGGTARFVAEENFADRVIKNSRTNFNIAFGERVRLTDIHGNVMSMVDVTLMSADEVQWRGRDGRFYVVPVG